MSTIAIVLIAIGALIVILLASALVAAIACVVVARCGPAEG
jgi:hypothetical protein